MTNREIEQAVEAVLSNLRPQIEAEVRRQATRKDAGDRRMVDVVRMDSATPSSKDARFDEAVRTGVLAACKALNIPTTVKSDEEEFQERLDAEYDEVRRMYESAWRS